jgi:hypothetical protein
MIFPFSRRSHSGSFPRSVFSVGLAVSPCASRPAWRCARALTAWAAAILCWGGASIALAQTPAPADAREAAPTAVPAAVTTDPATELATEPAATPTFAPASPWDAPEPWRTDRFYTQFAYYTLHFHYDSRHRQSYLIDGEYHFQDYWLGGQWIAGVALFQNSFGQFSQYVFGGLQWRPSEEHQPLYIKLTAGPLHGYEGQYRDKVPLNHYGTGLAIIPSIGYCLKRYCGEMAFLGTNAMLFTIGMTIP